ncbi:protein S100-A10 [Strigops habroptila]|uniref:protein S100-A10 n=1 Tax=Strigops habroptila TaxID=2489341 RepID=UPI0011D02888|nr:protein S100-A10 [Strigops habroptila]
MDGGGSGRGGGNGDPGGSGGPRKGLMRGAGESAGPARTPPARPCRAYPGRRRAPPLPAALPPPPPPAMAVADGAPPWRPSCFTFHKYAGDKNHLGKEDLRALMRRKFPGFLENQRDPMALDKIMKDLDQCRDGKVGFQGFFSLVAGLTIACNDYFVLHMKQKGRK